MHCFCKKVKSYHCKIILLDEQELIKEIQDNSRGQEVLDTVFTHLNLIETAYFGLRYLDGSNQTVMTFSVWFNNVSPTSLDSRALNVSVTGNGLSGDTRPLGGKSKPDSDDSSNFPNPPFQQPRHFPVPVPGLVIARETVTALEEIAKTFGENPINGRHWLDPAKKIVKQLKGTDPFSLYFGVKFYAADPCKLLEEITRYQFFLQVKQDILQGRLPVTFDVAAELGAYVVQSELGDYDPRRHSPGYVSEFRLTSNQSAELESRIEELHKGLIGQLPAAAELSYLEKVKWLEMYGVDLHPVLGEDNVEYFLGLTPSGIIVLRNKNKVGHYYWPRISKIYFKGRYFMIRICDKNNEENTYGFETPSKPACKHLWKCCVEHHAFFRLVQVSPTSPDIFTLGSRFRYSGRTEKQAQADAQMRLRSPPNFCRTPSRRYQRRRVEGAPDVPKISDLENRENISPQEMKMVSIPQPVVSVAGVYRSTSSIPAVLQSQGRNESPRSTRSAPWSQLGHVRGLYNSTTSPRSVRSAGQVQCSQHLMPKMTQRSSSVDSQSSNDSRSCKRRHRSRKSSDNESELSKCSNRSHHWQRRRSQSKRDSDSEKDHHHHHHHHHRHRHKSGSSSRRRQSSRYELVDSEAQWKEVQKRQAEGSTGVHHATVISNKDRRSGYMNSGMETESEMSYHRKRKQKKHRSRSRSPSDGGKGRLPDELKKHLEFKLIDTEGMSESQLREIPYKVVETSAGKSHRKYSPSSKRKNNAGNNRKQKRTPNEEDNAKVSNENQASQMSNHLSEGSRNKNANVNVSSGDSGHFSNTGPGSNSSTISNSAFADFLNKNRNGLMPSSHAAQDQLPSRNCQLLPRNSSASENNYVKTPGQKTHGSYLTANANSLPKKNIDKVQCLHTSALYGNPTTLLGNINEINQNGRFSNGKNSTNMKNETDDSGLSVDSQEQTYLKTVRSFKQIQGQAREGAVNPGLRSEFRNQNRDDPESLQDNNHHYVDFDGGFYSTVNFINNNSITKSCLPDAIGTTRSDGIINQKKLRGPLYVQSRSSTRFAQNVPRGNLDSGLEKRRSASLEFILSPIIKSTYQPSALD